MDAQQLVNGNQDGHAQLPQVIDSQCYPICDTTGATLDSTGTAGYFHEGPYECNAGPYTVGTQVGCTDGCMLTDGYACVNSAGYPSYCLQLAQKHVEMECLMLEKNVIQVPTMKP